MYIICYNRLLISIRCYQKSYGVIEPHGLMSIRDRTRNVKIIPWKLFHFSAIKYSSLSLINRLRVNFFQSVSIPHKISCNKRRVKTSRNSAERLIEKFTNFCNFHASHTLHLQRARASGNPANTLNFRIFIGNERAYQNQNFSKIICNSLLIFHYKFTYNYSSSLTNEENCSKLFSFVLIRALLSLFILSCQSLSNSKGSD